MRRKIDLEQNVEMRNAYKMFIKPEGKRPLGKPWHVWEDNIKIDLKEMGYVWIRLTQDRY
jgi:hypothetical protein